MRIYVLDLGVFAIKWDRRPPVVKLSEDVVFSSFRHSLPTDRWWIACSSEKKHTKIAAFLWPSPTYTSTYGARDVSRTFHQPDHTVNPSEKDVPLQRLRSESKCVMADSRRICVDYLYLVHNGVIVDPLIEPAVTRLSRTRLPSRHCVVAKRTPQESPAPHTPRWEKKIGSCHVCRSHVSMCHILLPFFSCSPSLCHQSPLVAG